MWIAALALAAWAAAAQGALAAPPDITSSYGSGSFGRWKVDRFNLPFYRYAIDPETAPQARQPELGGNTDAWHQLGNDHIVATAHNDGRVQLWSQDRAFQWTNRNEPAADHFSGGYGYLGLSDQTISTLYADRPPDARTRRDFGAGYFHRQTVTKPAAVDERVYAPFGDAPLLIHEVRIRNTSESRLGGNWFEYWDVNPFDEAEGRKTHLGLTAPQYSRRLRALSVGEAPDAADSDPLRIFAAALRGRVESWETDATKFFGAGGRAEPAQVAAGELGGSIGPPARSARRCSRFRRRSRSPQASRSPRATRTGRPTASAYPA